LTLGYSSGSVDGRTTSTNSQTSWVGEGWDLQFGYIERGFRSCADDGSPSHGGDLCYFSDGPATMVFGSRSVRLIKDDTTGVWRGETDDGSRIERLVDAALDNGGVDAGQTGVYWKVTTTDGTQYFFGRNKRYSGDPAATNSTLRVPVFSNHSWEPCYNANQRWSMCNQYQIYRWNLDYVVDPRGNSMTYFYQRYTAKYGAYNGMDARFYDLTGAADHIDYGTRAGSEGAGSAPMRVDLVRGLRCVDACTVYPDTPWDLECDPAAASCPQLSPTFFTPWRLASVQTKVWNPSAAGYRMVDQYDLTPLFPDPTDGSQPALWFNYFVHTGKAGTTDVTMPQMHFGGTGLRNRVAGVPATRYRISSIATGAGGQTTVEYSPTQCTAGDVPNLVAHNNNMRCFPQWDGSANGWSWFHKYLVTAVVDTDLTGGSPAERTEYSYSLNWSTSGVMWASDRNETAADNRRTWSDFAGYTNVTTSHGPPGGTRTVTHRLFYRGLHGDPLPSGNRSSSIVDDVGNTQVDHQPFRGYLREEETFDGSGNPLVKHLYLPTLNNGPTATRSGYWLWGHARAFPVLTDWVQTGTWIAATNSWRWTRTDTDYNTYQLPTVVKDYGDIGPNHDQLTNTGDDTCTTTTYATPNTTKWMIDYPAQTVTTDCTASPSGGNYLSGSQTQYDGGAVGVAPTIGLATRTNALASVSGTTLTWAQAGRAGYDSYGRVTTAYDALDHATTTTYTPTIGGPVTGMTMTNSANHVVTTALDGIRGLPLTVVDPNNKTTTLQYDALGRLRKVFKPHTSGPSTTLPDLEYTYTLRNNGPNTVSTKKLGPNGNQIESFELYDGHFRPRQTQAPAAQANGGRMITDIVYDTRGLAAKTSTFWNNTAPSGSALYTFADTDVQNQHRYSYDGLERKTLDAQYAANVLKWQTSVGYDGDRSWTIPPAGGTTTMTITNAQGKTTALRQYLTGAPPSGGTYQTTSYSYDRLQRLTTVTDPAGNQWTNGYDLRGRVTSTSDPDKGSQSATFDNAGQMLTTTDARGVTLAYSYDDLGRKTGVFDGSTSGFKRAGWVYDTIAKGQLTSSSRYFNSTDTYTTAAIGYNDQYQPLGASVTIPVVTGQPAGTYTVNTAYDVDGSVASNTYPAAGGLAAETVTNTYDNTGRLLTVAGAETYVSGTSYYNFGPVYQRLLGSGTKRVRQTTAVDEATGRLTTNKTETQNQTTTSNWDEKLTEAYGYDNAGNVKSINETAAGTTVSNQCFAYDVLRQLTEAWTTTVSACQATPSLAVLGGPDSYWTSYAYNNATGNRTSETKHRASGPNIDRAYTYPTTGQRHTLTSVATTGAAIGTDSYGYDAAGNVTTRNIAGKPGQTLTWDNEGHLAGVTDSGGTTSYIYDPEGNRLVAKEPNRVTVYLFGFELQTVSGITTCTRYYGDVSSRTTGGSLIWLITDHHGTSQLAIDATTLAVTRRKSDPFGNPRGSDPAWPNTRGFVNGTRDNTGLTHLGAREYEPATGRFVSDDPVTDTGDPLQMHGYAYGNSAPTTSSDASGLRTCSDVEDCKGDSTHGNPGYGNGAAPESSRPGYHRARSPWKKSQSPPTVKDVIDEMIRVGSGGSLSGLSDIGGGACEIVLGKKQCAALKEELDRILDKLGGEEFDCSKFPDAERCMSDLNGWMKDAYEHLEGTMAFCDGVCLGLEFQGGNIHLVAGVGAPGGFGGTIVYQSLPYEEQGSIGVAVCAAAKVGFCVSVGPKVDSEGNWTGVGWSAGVAFGVSEVKPAIGYTLGNYNLHTGKFTPAQNPLPPKFLQRACRLSWLC
jgi:RHS repeat-associated protein